MARFSLILTVLSVCGSPTGGRAEDPAVASTRKRQELIQSSDLTFHVQEVVAKGSYSVAAESMPGGKAGLIIPAQETTLESDNRFVIEGRKVRFESEHPLWHLPNGTLTKKKTIAASDGEQSRVFFPEGVSIDAEVTGIIRRDGRVDEIKTYLVTPLLLHLRGVDDVLAPYNIQSARRTGKSVPFGTKLCEIYEFILSKDSLVELWLDPKDDYLLNRLRKLRRGNVYEQYEVQYQKSVGGVAFPNSWVRTEYDSSGKVRKTAKIQVTNLQVNPVANEEDFKVTFPPGCHVHDQRVNKEYKVQTSGDFRELNSRGEESGEVIASPDAPWAVRNKWLLIGLITAAALVLVARIVRGRQARDRGPNSPPGASLGG